MLKANVSAKNIETADLKLERTEPDPTWTAEMKRDRQFTARQSWSIRVTASAAQRVVDMAVAAGANAVEQPDWDVADPTALQAKAGAAALKKARAVAEQMAQ